MSIISIAFNKYTSYVTRLGGGEDDYNSSFSMVQFLSWERVVVMLSGEQCRALQSQLGVLCTKLANPNPNPELRVPLKPAFKLRGLCDNSIHAGTYQLIKGVSSPNESYSLILAQRERDGVGSICSPLPGMLYSHATAPNCVDQCRSYSFEKSYSSLYNTVLYDLVNVILISAPSSSPSI